MASDLCPCTPALRAQQGLPPLPWARCTPWRTANGAALVGPLGPWTSLTTLRKRPATYDYPGERTCPSVGKAQLFLCVGCSHCRKYGNMESAEGKARGSGKFPSCVRARPHHNACFHQNPFSSILNCTPIPACNGTFFPLGTHFCNKALKSKPVTHDRTPSDSWLVNLNFVRVANMLVSLSKRISSHPNTYANISSKKKNPE